jgi:hypothetical protein
MALYVLLVLDYYMRIILSVLTLNIPHAFEKNQ